MKNFGLHLGTWPGTNMLLFCGLHCGVQSSLFLTTISALVLWLRMPIQLKTDLSILHCLMLPRRFFNMKVGLVSTLVSTPSTCVLSSTLGLLSSSPIKSPPNGREMLALRNGRFENKLTPKQIHYFSCQKYIAFYISILYLSYSFAYELSLAIFSTNISLYSFSISFSFQL